MKLTSKQKNSILELVKKIAQHSGAIYAVCYSQSLDLIFTGGADKVVASWNPITFENTPFSIKTQSAIVTLSVLDDQFLFIGLFNGSFHVIDLSTKQEIKFITKHKQGIFACAVDNKTNSIVIGSGDGRISIWDKKFNLLFEQTVGNGKIRAIECINGIAYIGTSSGELLQISLDEFSLISKTTINPDGISSICFLPEKNSFLIGGKNAWIYVYDIKKSAVIHSFPAHNWAIYKIILHQKKVYTCSRDKIIKEWNSISLDLIQRYCLPQYKGHTHSINNMISIDKYDYLVSVSDDKSVIIWK